MCHEAVLALIGQLYMDRARFVIEVSFPTLIQKIRVVSHHPLLGPMLIVTVTQTGFLYPDILIRGTGDLGSYRLGIDHVTRIHLSSGHPNQVVVVHGPAEESPKLNARTIQVSSRDRISQGPFGP